MGFLDGITVLDLASVGPAARASGYLADYGADIVKVGPLPASTGVQITPLPHLYSGGRGTRRIQLDLKADAGRQTFLRLTEHADVVIESFRPGVVDRLGIGYDEVKSRNPAVVYCSTSGYGQTGPRSQWAGHDINYLAVGGFLAHTEPGDDGKPPRPGATVADAAAGGMHAVMAILAALVGRAANGEGSYLDVSVADGVLSLMSLQIDDHLATGRTSAAGTAPLSQDYAWYDVYRAADGNWLSVGAIEPKFYANLCRLLDLEQWTGHQHDLEAQADIRRDFATAFATRTRDEWIDLLAPSDTCVAPVLSVVEAAESAPTAKATHPAVEDFQQLAPLLAGAHRADEYSLPDQALTDSDQVLTSAGFSSEEIETLRREGVLG